MVIYKHIIKPILFLFKPETAHNFTILTQTMACKLKLKPLIKPFFSYHNSVLETSLFGLNFPNPIGLPAGCDKKGTALNIWEAFGFGYTTIGSVTHLAQPGNLKPRLWRMLKDQSFQVNFGLNGKGAAYTKKILTGVRPKNPYGISIARTTNIPDEEVVEDYLETFKTLYELPDYFEINISCPNIPDTDYFKRGNFLPSLLSKLQTCNTKKKPLLLKISPCLSEEEMDLIIKNVLDYKIDGVIISNLLKDFSQIQPKTPLNQGGISGKLLEPFNNKAIGDFYKKTKGKVPIIGLGGIFTAEDAYKKIKLGASMVQIYTGMVFEGPGVIKKIARRLAELAKKDGYTNIAQAVGADWK